MPDELNVLILEDSDTDALLAVRELESAGFGVSHRRVEDALGAREALEQGEWDLVLSDYVMPQFTALDALEMVKELGLDIPFIILSGRISEETAVEAMKAGAHDYLMKDNLARLGEAIRRELQEAEVRRNAAKIQRERQAALKRLDHINRVLQSIRNINQLIVAEKDPQHLAEEACRMLTETRGYNGAWIILGDPNSEPEHCAQAGFGADFQEFYDPVRGGSWPRCTAEVLNSPDYLITLTPSESCGGCPLASEYGDHPAVVVGLAHGQRLFGFLGVSDPDDRRLDEEERALLTEVAGDLAFALRDMEMEREGRERERQFRILFETMNQGVVYQDAEGQIIQANPAAERILGLTLDQMQGRTSLDPRWAAVRQDGTPLPGEEHPAMVALQTGEPHDLVMGVFNPQEERHRWIKAHSIPEFQNTEEHPFRVFSTFEDITELREAQESLEASEQLLEATGRIARIGGWEVDAQTKEVSWTQITREIHEVSDEYVPTLEKAIGFFHPEGRSRLGAAIARALQEGKPYDMEVRFISARGRELWTHTRCQPIMEGDRVVRLRGTFQDITMRKEALQEMASSERRFRSLFQNSLAPIVITDQDGHYLDANPAACRLFGYEREKLLRMSLSDLLAASPNRSREQVGVYLRGSQRSGTFSFLRPDGQRRVVAWSTAEIDEGIRAGVLRDITELLRKEEELRTEKEKAQRFLDVAAVMLLGLDPEGRITLLNRAGHETLETPQEHEILGRDWFEFIPDEEREGFRTIFQEILSGRDEAHRRVEGQIQTAQGNLRWMVWHNAAIRDEEGRIVGTLFSGEDITERREMEAQLAQADRLSSMGMLAAGVAHEINNPLTYVLYNLESLNTDLSPVLKGIRTCRDLLQDHMGPEELEAVTGEAHNAMDPTMLADVKIRFEEAMNGAQRIREIVRSLSTFARVEREEAVPVDLRNVAEVAVNLGFNEIKYRARLVKDFQRIPPVMASEGRLAQVFLNLIINAAHAIEEGEVEKNEIRIRTWAEDEEVCAEVRDTGCGIAPEHMDRLFEPFFTTKKIGVGSGLGLAISQSIIENYGGSITAESEPGEGTSFFIRLPALEREAGEGRPRPAEGSGAKEPGVSGRLLIVDDEASVRSSLARVLREHEVVEAESGAEAQEILSQDSDFHLILCDMMMSDVSGMDLHQWLTQHHPTLAKQFIFMTGGAFTPRSREYLAKVDNIRLEKPFEVANIRNLVTELIRKGGGGEG